MTPALIVLDWGTTTLRASLLDADGATLETRTEPWGIMQVPNGDFGAAYASITAGWQAPGINAIASGMIGSANGWTLAPYRAAPASVADLSDALVNVPGTTLHIVPGLATRGDVMRGEETQVLGALLLQPALNASSLLLLPGTHSKWVHIREGRVGDFTTYMTGEFFAVLRDHSILGRLSGSLHDGLRGTDAFALGVLAAKASNQGIAPLLFSARAMVLTDVLSANVSLNYLSGLLIGDEVRCGLAAGAVPSALIGDASLCALYSKALAIFDIDGIPFVEGAVHAGLWAIAMRAGIVKTST